MFMQATLTMTPRYCLTLNALSCNRAEQYPHYFSNLALSLAQPNRHFEPSILVRTSCLEVTARRFVVERFLMSYKALMDIDTCPFMRSQTWTTRYRTAAFFFILAAVVERCADAAQ